MKWRGVLLVFTHCYLTFHNYFIDFCVVFPLKKSWPMKRGKIGATPRMIFYSSNYPLGAIIQHTIGEKTILLILGEINVFNLIINSWILCGYIGVVFFCSIHASAKFNTVCWSGSKSDSKWNVVFLKEPCIGIPKYNSWKTGAQNLWIQQTWYWKWIK